MGLVCVGLRFPGLGVLVSSHLPVPERTHMLGTQ